jgi:hypothetical protein
MLDKLDQFLKEADAVGGGLPIPKPASFSPSIPDPASCSKDIPQVYDTGFKGTKLDIAERFPVEPTPLKYKPTYEGRPIVAELSKRQGRLEAASKTSQEALSRQIMSEANNGSEHVLRNRVAKPRSTILAWMAKTTHRVPGGWLNSKHITPPAPTQIGDIRNTFSSAELTPIQKVIVEKKPALRLKQWMQSLSARTPSIGRSGSAATKVAKLGTGGKFTAGVVGLTGIAMVADIVTGAEATAATEEAMIAGGADALAFKGTATSNVGAFVPMAQVSRVDQPFMLPANLLPQR